MVKARLKVIKGGTLIDGTGREPIENAFVLIEDDKIKTVGKQSDAEDFAGAEVIDAKGKYVLPGLIDMHVHFHSWTTELLINHGITTIYDLGNILEFILAVREAVNNKKILNHPRIFCVGPMLNSLPLEGPGCLDGSLIPLENSEQARKVCKDLIARGVDGIKLYWNSTIEVCKAAANECQKAGIPLSLHVDPCEGNAADAREIARTGVDCLVHASGIGLANISDPEKRKKFRTETLPKIPSGKFPHYLWVSDPSNEPWHWMEPKCFDETIDILLKEGVVINPTLVFAWKCVHGRQAEFDKQVLELSQNPELSYIPSNFFPMYLDYAGCSQLLPEERDNVRQGYEKLQQFLNKFAKAGGIILPGSDPVHSGLPGLGLHQEMQLMHDLGLSPMDIIVSATKHSAEFIRKEDKIGTIEKNKLADFVILSADPLKDINNLKKIEVVIKDGVALEMGYHKIFRHPMSRPYQVSAFDEIDCQQKINIYDSISPEAVVEGAGPFTLTVNGKNFFRTSTISFNGVNLPTEFINVTQLKAIVPAKLIEKPGVFFIYVMTPFREITNKVPIFVKFK